MANIKNQRMVQMGEETTWGTAVAPTVELSGIDPDAIQISPSIVTEIVRGARGGIVPGRDTITVRLTLTRAGQTVALSATPEAKFVEGKTIGQLGIDLGPNPTAFAAHRGEQSRRCEEH